MAMIHEILFIPFDETFLPSSASMPSTKPVRERVDLLKDVVCLVSKVFMPGVLHRPAQGGWVPREEVQLPSKQGGCAGAHI